MIVHTKDIFYARIMDYYLDAIQFTYIKTIDRRIYFLKRSCSLLTLLTQPKKSLTNASKYSISDSLSKLSYEFDCSEVHRANFSSTD